MRRGTVRRWSFRTRLTMTIGAVFVAAAAALLIIEYVAVSALFDRAVGGSQFGVAGSTTATVMYRDGSGAGADVAVLAPGPLVGSGTVADPGAVARPALPPGVAAAPVLITSIDGENVRQWFVGQTDSLAGEVLTGLLVWSGVVLLAFVALATLISWWLARRAVRRIGEVTAMAQDLSTHDLSRRLDLPGPSDEIKELADTIDAMLDRLESSFASQDRFVANASHELRTPLTTARTALEIPLSQGRVPDDLEPAFRTALRAGRHSEDLIAGLLTLARSGRPSAVEPVDLADVVPAALADARDILLDKDIRVHLTSNSVVVDGDRMMLTQAVRNLVDNAIVHNESDGDVWIDVGPDGLVVENTGAVIDPAVVQLLIEPFYRLETRTGGAGRTGAGLGLSIVRSIATAHDGSLEISTRPGGGLRAALVIPAADRQLVAMG